MSFSRFRRPIYSWAKRRPALVVVNLPGDDLILRAKPHRDANAIPLDNGDFDRGGLNARSFIRPNRLFTVEQSVILYSAAQVTQAKLDETLAKLRQLFS